VTDASLLEGNGRGGERMPMRTIVGMNGVAAPKSVPTEAPDRELVKRRLERRVETVTCTDWSIAGGEIAPFAECSGYVNGFDK